MNIDKPGYPQSPWKPQFSVEMNKKFISQQTTRMVYNHRGILREVNMTSILNSSINQQRVDQ